MLTNIHSFKIPITCLTATIYLENLSQRVNILSLYQKIFPEQWLESTIPIDKHSHRESAYLDREIEFIRLVNKNMFPIEYIDEIEFVSSHDSIPISPQKLEWWSEDFDDLEYSEKFLVSLMGQGYNIGEWELHFGFTAMKAESPRAYGFLSHPYTSATAWDECDAHRRCSLVIWFSD